MTDPGTALLLPLGLGLLGFIEPCSIGTMLLFIKLIEEKSRSVKLAQTLAFATSRAIFTGLLGVGAALVGTAFLEFQRIGWLVMGLVYIAIGALYLTGRVGWMMRSIGPRFAHVSDTKKSAALGIFFGLNIPACAGPLLLTLLASTASGTSGGGLLWGFVSLALFGFALSLPLIVAVLFPAARRGLDWLAARSAKIPKWTGLLLIGLGIWSVWFGLFVSIK